MVAVLGDAVPVDVNNESLGNKPGPVIAKVRYDTYGVPTICDPADIDRDGVVDIADVALYCVYWNAITSTHAELGAFQQAANAGMRAGTGKLFVEAELCSSCGLYGGVKALGQQLGLRELIIVTPNGVVTIYP